DPAADPARADEPAGVRDPRQRPPRGDRSAQERRARRGPGGRAPLPAPDRAHPPQRVPPRAVRSARQGKQARAEERKDERVTINKEFESYDAFINEYVTNISRSGVFVRSKTPLPVGTRVNLRFTVIMDDIETIEGVGCVVRVHDDPSGMGVVFTELGSYSKSLVDVLLTNALGSPTDEGWFLGLVRWVALPA